MSTKAYKMRVAYLEATLAKFQSLANISFDNQYDSGKRKADGTILTYDHPHVNGLIGMAFLELQDKLDTESAAYMTEKTGKIVKKKNRYKLRRKKNPRALPEDADFKIDHRPMYDLLGWDKNCLNERGHYDGM